MMTEHPSNAGQLSCQMSKVSCLFFLSCRTECVIQFYIHLIAIGRKVMIMTWLTHWSFFFKSGTFKPLNSQINTFKTSFADAIKKLGSAWFCPHLWDPCQTNKWILVSNRGNRGNHYLEVFEKEAFCHFLSIPFVKFS